MVYDITRRSSYNHLSSWLSDTRNLTNPGTVSFFFIFQLNCTVIKIFVENQCQEHIY